MGYLLLEMGLSACGGYCKNKQNAQFVCEGLPAQTIVISGTHMQDIKKTK